MSSVETTEIFECSVDDFYKIISDFESYPEFLSEVAGCHVVQEDANRKLVEYHISMIKDFRYRLWMDLEPPRGIHWQLDSGDLFKMSNGFWKLEDEGGKTRATYSVDAKFKVFVPGPIAKKLINVNLPNMMSSYHKRVEQLYGRS